jgi:hypothetical protein
VAGALNTGGDAFTTSVSCASAGNCGAGGNYTDSSGNSQAFAVDQVNGAWGTGTEVAAALNTGRYAYISSVSCVAAGNCSAGGTYTDSTGATQAFVVSKP